MTAVVMQMAMLIACGGAWRIIRPGGLDADTLRRALSDLVYYLLMPALVLDVLAQHPISAQTAAISLFGSALVLTGSALAWCVCRFLPLSSAQRGAAILAVSFPNVTFLGLPVLEATFGNWARAIAIQIDLFACLPWLFTWGTLIARHYGAESSSASSNAGRALLKVPAIWAVMLAMLLQMIGWSWPEFCAGAFARLAAATAPLMLFALGLSLTWRVLRGRTLGLSVPIVALRLLALPALASGALLHGFTLAPAVEHALILEAAMPSMVFGVVLCDRFNLDSGFYAALVSLGTATALLTLPMWWQMLGPLNAGH